MGYVLFFFSGLSAGAVTVFALWIRADMIRCDKILESANKVFEATRASVERCKARADSKQMVDELGLADLPE